MMYYYNIRNGEVVTTLTHENQFDEGLLRATILLAADPIQKAWKRKEGGFPTWDDIYHKVIRILIDYCGFDIIEVECGFKRMPSAMVPLVVEG